MPRRIELSRVALADFDDIYNNLASHSARATTVLRKLDGAIQLLVDQPRMGRQYRHRNRLLRLLIAGEFLVFFRERPGVIELLRIIHGRRNIPDVLDEL